jgi:hypothetical protein
MSIRLRLSGRDREGLVQAAKMAVAAVVAWLAARQLGGPQSFIAPYAAVLIMNGTVYRSLVDAARQVTTVVLGVLVAFVVAVAVPWRTSGGQLVALAVAVFAGMVIGRWHRLGRDGIWVGVVALLMITYGTAADAGYLFYRAGDALVGAVIGVAVNVLILPPIHLRDVGAAVAAVSGEIEELLYAMAGNLRGGWDKDDALRWRRQARALETVVRHAEKMAGHGRESMRFNPRRLWSRSAHPSTEDAALCALYEVAAQVQHITETLVTSDDPDSTAPRTDPEFDRTLAVLLDELAAAVATYQAPSAERRRDGVALSGALTHVRGRRAAYARLVPWPGYEPPKDWSVHAAALLAVERALQSLLDA